MRPLLAGLVVLSLCFTGTTAINYRTRFPDVYWDDDNWHLTTTNFDPGHYQSRLSLSNGYLGINVAAAGPFFEVDKAVYDDNINGWPLFDRRQTFATIAGFYGEQERTNGSNYPWLDQFGGESTISGIPHWAGLMVEAEGETLDASVNPDEIDRYTFSSTLDVAGAVLSWKYSWKPGGTGTIIDVEYSMFVHKLHVNQAAVQLKLTASRDTTVTVYDVLDGDCAVRTDFAGKGYEADETTIWSAVRPSDISNVTAYIYSTLKGDSCIDFGTRALVKEGRFGKNQSSIAQSVQINLQAGKTTEVDKYVGAASSDAFPDAQAIAKNASCTGASRGYADLLHDHIQEWNSILPPSSVDSYYLPNGSLPDNPDILELQITAVTNPFYILQNTVGAKAIAAAGNNTSLASHSIPVCGLGSDCYAGFIFWDAEIWMAPGLQVSHPQAMQQIMNYRIEKYPQAQENIKWAFTSSQNQTGKFSAGGAVYPWTSARNGNCTGTGPCFDYEYHINGDIGLSFYNQYTVSGDGAYFKEQLLPISNAIAHFYAELLTFNESSGMYVLRNATDPDEYTNNVDNLGFTTALIQSHLNETNRLNTWFGLPVNETWMERAGKMRIPTNDDAQIVLEYSTMNGSISVKQADVILIDDLLPYDNPYALQDLDYYAAKQSSNGPGMTYSVFSIVANEISPSGCSSYSYDLYGSQPYTRAPWFQFSEQLLDEFDSNGGTHPAFPFLTGMGGANRVAVFGYLSLRLFVDRLDIDPSLPPQIPYLNYRVIYWQGHGLNIISNATHTTLARLPRENFTLPTANETFFTEPIPVTLGSRPGKLFLHHQTLTIENRMAGHKLTVQDNILQCVTKVTSSSPYLPGQFPRSAIDGASSTKWQPAVHNATAILSIDMGDQYFPIREILLDWGNIPPVAFSVFFSNYSGLGYRVKELQDNSTRIVNVTWANNVPFSQPWDPASANVIKPYIGNQTNVSLPHPVWSGRFVHLLVEGNANAQSEIEAPGATVAEWSLIKVGGAPLKMRD
ncbi:glycosyl hydrolase family 65 central catalytic domain-domain-containing protein [Clohesyomyces aquaticus]|uniref:alpha,alpha-trehalase n=1 Tax=Clohesyomyces aquaticus TaxID=1231657 RepID=A0A1Y1ZVM0_9PLEO|nr:glycosyl hydrolase family 65 central catalytic domain-domain-containing protein [Clohesyomyces aquaticus]